MCLNAYSSSYVYDSETFCTPKHILLFSLDFILLVEVDSLNYMSNLFQGSFHINPTTPGSQPLGFYWNLLCIHIIGKK